MSSIVDRGLKDEFGILYRENYERVFRVAVACMGQAEDAEEIVQEAFLKAFRGYREFRGDSTVTTWITRIVLNACRDQWKRRRKLPLEVLTEDEGHRLEDLADMGRGNDPETMLLSREAQFKCLHCLTECLPEAQRQAFCLAVTLDLPHRTVAGILGTSEGAVKASLHRAMKRWKGYMENRCEFIKASNPCRCKQWIRFGQERGWIRPETPVRNEVDMVFRNEIIRLRDLCNLYHRLYAGEAERFFAERLAEGMERQEWMVLGKKRANPE